MTVLYCLNMKVVLPPIGNKCRQFCTSLVQSLYYVSDSYFRSEGVDSKVIFSVFFARTAATMHK
jgi:hypothetical protein